MDWRDKALELLVSAHEALQQETATRVPPSKLRRTIAEAYACVEQVASGYLRERNKISPQPAYRKNLLMLLQLKVITLRTYNALIRCGTLRRLAVHEPYQAPPRNDVELSLHYALILLKNVGLPIDHRAFKLPVGEDPEPGDLVIGTVQDLRLEANSPRPPIQDFTAQIQTESGHLAKLSHWNMSWKLLTSVSEIEAIGIRQGQELIFKVLSVLPPPSGLHVGYRQVDSPPNDWNSSNDLGCCEVEVLAISDHDVLVLTDTRYIGFIEEDDVLWSTTMKRTEMLKIGQKIRVRALKIESEREMGWIKFSLKDTLSDPWENNRIKQQYPVGHNLSALITRCRELDGGNVFVGIEIEPLIEGTINRKGIRVCEQLTGLSFQNLWKQMVPGKVVDVQVHKIDETRRVILLDLVRA